MKMVMVQMAIAVMALYCGVADSVTITLLFVSTTVMGK